jgi:rod shape determining protein RodA
MRNSSIKSSYDWLLVAIVFALLMLGVINLYSAAYRPEFPSIFDIRAMYGKQIMWIGVGTFLGVVISLIDSEYIRKLTPAAFLTVLVLLVLVLFTEPINGARSWLGIGPFGIQPSEFSKFTTALMIAYVIQDGRGKTVRSSTVFKVILIIMLSMLLVLLQNDTGTFLVFTAFFFVIYREGITFDPIILFFLNSVFRLRLKQTWVGVHFIPVLFVIIFFGIITLYFAESKHSFAFLPGMDVPGWVLLITILSTLAVVFLIIIKRFSTQRNKRKFNTILIITYASTLLMVGTISYTYLNILQHHQKVRIDLWLGKVQDKDGEDYNRNRALASVGSGGLKGVGYKQAVLSSPESQHVPESETDFIFCVYSEEWGFIGTSILMLLYTSLLVRLVFLAERQRSRFARVFIYSVSMILFYHFAINVGMNIGVLPVIGIPLPFMSYGGSSIMAFLVMIFVVLKLDSQRKQVLA